MAARTGLSKPTVGRIWELGPRLHLQDSVKLSTNPFLGEKVDDRNGLHHYMPEKHLLARIRRVGARR
jgi:hypothetical protein